MTIHIRCDLCGRDLTFHVMRKAMHGRLAPEAKYSYEGRSWTTRFGFLIVDVLFDFFEDDVGLACLECTAKLQSWRVEGPENDTMGFYGIGHPGIKEEWVKVGGVPEGPLRAAVRKAFEKEELKKLKKEVERRKEEES